MILITMVRLKARRIPIASDERGSIQIKDNPFGLSKYESEMDYAEGLDPSHYPVPAKLMRSFEYWRNLGEVLALNNFDIATVQTINRYR